jgi:hypothetical protein
VVEPLSVDDLTKPNTISYLEHQDTAVGKDEMEEKKMKRCQECSCSESQDWNSHLVCDNGGIDGMRLCAVQKDGPPDDVGVEWAMTLGEVMVAGPCTRGSFYQIIVTRWRHFDVSQHVIRCSLSEE